MDEAARRALIDDVVALTEMIGPSGHEDPVQDVLEARWRAAGCATQRTRVGNLFAHVGGRGPKLLVAAHADEIALRVKSITADGHVVLTGGDGGGENNPPNATFLAQACAVVTPKGLVHGVVGAATGHVRARVAREPNRLEWTDLFLDVGARSAEQARAWGVHAGAPVVLEATTRQVGGNLVGKAMDDRAALAVLLHLAERVDRERLTVDLWLASTVQEEVGLIGAGSVDGFDLAIALEVGLAGDIPPVGLDHVPARLGGGLVLGHKDGGVAYDVKLTRRLEAVAVREGLPVQHQVMHNFASDGKAFMINGVPTALVAFPTRYTHSPIESIDVDDLVGVLRLLEAFVVADGG